MPAGKQVRFRYRPEHLDWLRRMWPKYGLPVLTAAFNLRFDLAQGVGAVKSALSNHAIGSGRSTGNRVGTLRSYNREQYLFIREHYRQLTLPELTAAFNAQFDTSRETSQLKAFIHNHGLHSGRTGCFEPGNQPWNTGTKGATSANRTSFKKGAVPKSQRPIGSERICSKDGYILIKTDQVNPHTGFRGHWRHKHVVVWEAAHGPVPAGMCVIIKDGVKANIELDNLDLVSRNELARLNQAGYGELPAELKPVALTMARLKVKTFERLKEAR